MLPLILAIVFCAVIPVILAITACVADRNVPHFSKPPAKLVRSYAGTWICCLIAFIVIGLIESPISPVLGYWIGGFLCLAAFGLLCMVGFAEYGYN